MRAINYDGKGNVMAYHAIANADGSTTEHTAMVALSSIPNGTNPDGKMNPDSLILTCPTCGAQGWVPIIGDVEAQRLHAMVRVAKGVNTPFATAAIQAVINEVKAKGGTPLLTLTDNPLKPLLP